MTEPDYYKILGVTPTAESSQIRQAYRRRVRDAHPDAGGDPEQFHALQEAYENLTDPQLRLEYDAAHGRRRPAWRTHRGTRRHTKNRKVKAWRVNTAVDDTATVPTGNTDVMARPWFIDIDPARRLRYNPSVWQRGIICLLVTAAWLTTGWLLTSGILASDTPPPLKALIIPYALLSTAVVVVAAARARTGSGRLIVVAAVTGTVIIWITGAADAAVGVATHLTLATAVPWCVARLRRATRLRTAVRSALRQFNAFGPAGARPSADRRTGAVLRALLERLPAARLFVRVPVGTHRAEYTVVCGRRVAVITPPVARTPTDTGADHLPRAVHEVAQLLGNAQVRGFVVWPTLPVDRISGTDAIIRHLSASDAAGEIGRWLGDDPYTLHLPTLRRLRDRLAGADTATGRRTRSTVKV